MDRNRDVRPGTQLKHDIAVPAGEPDPLTFQIQMRRRQILVNSILYYALDTNLVPDYIFDQWCRDLAGLQEQYPTESGRAALAEYFTDFDRSTGYNLPLKDPHYLELAQQLQMNSSRRPVPGINP